MATQVLAAQTIGASRIVGAIRQPSGTFSLCWLSSSAHEEGTDSGSILLVKRIDNTRLVKADDPVRLREMRTFTTAIVTLFLLLMFYGWQHFSAIEYGYRVETEKQQREVLEEQNRQLRLSEAQLSEPAKGLTGWRGNSVSTPPQPGQVVRPEAALR